MGCFFVLFLAIHDYQHALELDESLSRAKEGLQHAKKLQKQAEKRDYYQILDVSPTASKEDIMKAYRKKAAKYHPDNQKNKSDFEKELARKIFIDVAAAKEVLTDPGKCSLRTSSLPRKLAGKFVYLRCGSLFREKTAV